MQIVLDRAKLARLRQAGEGIFLRDAGQSQRAVDYLANPLRGQVAGGGRSRPLTQKDAQSQPARARFLQRFHLAHAHVHAELVTLARCGFGVRRAGLHGQRHDVGNQRFEVEGSFVGQGRSFRHVLKLSNAAGFRTEGSQLSFALSRKGSLSAEN